MLLFRLFLSICSTLILASEARGQYYYDTTHSKPPIIGSLKMSLLLGGEGFLSDTAFRQALKPIYSYPTDLTFIRFGAQFIFGNDIVPFEGVFQFGKVFVKPSRTFSTTNQSTSFSFEGSFFGAGVTSKLLKTEHWNIAVAACYNEIFYRLKVSSTSRNSNPATIFNSNSNYLSLDYNTIFFDPNITFNYQTTRDSFMQFNFGLSVDYQYFILTKSHWTQHGYPTTVVDLPFFEKGSMGLNLHFGIFLDFMYGKYPAIKL